MGNLARTSLTMHLGILSIPKFDFTSYKGWVLPKTAFLEGPPACLVVLSPPDVALYMGCACSKAKVFPTVGTHSGGLPTVNAHYGINMLLFCCRDNKGICCSSKNEYT